MELVYLWAKKYNAINHTPWGKPFFCLRHIER